MSLFLKALKGEKTDSFPVWMMRQAGRYLSSYRELRKKHSLEELFHQSDLAAEVTLLPFKRIPFDAAIVFSDILLILEAFGAKVFFPEQGGPYVELKDLHSLPEPDFLTLEHVISTIRKVLPSLTVPLIGFCGGPYTVLQYACSFEQELKDPPRLHRILEKVTDALIVFLKMQIHAGASAVQIFDSWAGLLPKEQFLEYALPYLKKMVRAIKLHAPVILFTRHSSHLIDELSSLQPNGISYDWDRPILDLREKTPSSICVQGNLNPSLLLTDHVLTEVKAMLESMKGQKGYIFNLGHGVLPTTSEKVVEEIVTLIKAKN